MKAEAWKPTSLPLYGCLTGIELPENRIDILQGLALRRIYVDTIGATMMAFAPPPTPQSHHPAPWAAVRGGFTFESRVELAITDTSAYDGLPPSSVGWLVAAVLRLRMTSPIRLAVIGNMPFDEMGERWSEVEAVTFESAPQQIGPFASRRVEATELDLAWLRDMLPVAARLYHDERFFRAFSIYNQALWSPTPEMGTVLVWTAIEALFDLGRERDKTTAICRALSGYLGADRPDRDRAYQVIRDLYYKRGQTVHAGRSMDAHDTIQSYQLASGAFQRVLIDGKLPPTPVQVIH